MRFVSCFFALVTVFSFSSVSQAHIAEIQIDHFNSDAKIADSDRWEGDLVCTWKDRDLYVVFSHPSQPRAFVLKVPSLKTVYNNDKINIELDSKRDEFRLTNDSRLVFSMRKESRCTVSAGSNGASVALSLRCDGLKDEVGQFYSNIRVHSPDFSCPKN